MLCCELRGHIVGLLVDGVVLSELVCHGGITSTQLVSVLVETGLDLGITESALGEFAYGVALLNPSAHQGILDLGSTALQLGTLLQSME